MLASFSVVIYVYHFRIVIYTCTSLCSSVIICLEPTLLCPFFVVVGVVVAIINHLTLPNLSFINSCPNFISAWKLWHMQTILSIEGIPPMLLNETLIEKKEITEPKIACMNVIPTK